jgi:hypothetical protein
LIVKDRLNNIPVFGIGTTNKTTLNEVTQANGLTAPWIDALP